MDDLASVGSWDEAQVGSWLRTLHMSHLEDNFVKNDVTGGVLLQLDNTLLKELEVETVGERVRLLTAIRSLRRAYASEVRRRHIAVSLGKWSGQDQLGSHPSGHGDKMNFLPYINSLHPSLTLASSPLSLSLFRVECRV